ncbi:MAG TPA: hypothetical protein VGC96_14360 [Candidatus Elarobacter sp.]
MRSYGVTELAAAVVLACATACAPQPAHVKGPPPANPDLLAVMERFYQQVEGAHWRFADGMLSPRYRAALGPAGIRSRYDGFADVDVTLRQSSGRSVVAAVTVVDRGATARKHRFEETSTLRWDGEDWTVDAIRRGDR